MGIDTVNDVTPRVQYTAIAAQVDFDYPFPIFADADLTVEVDGTTQTLTTDYTVTGAGNDAGGTVTFGTAPGVGAVVTIYRDTALSRSSDFGQNGPFLSSAINDEIDQIYLIAQELENKIGRALRMPQAGAADNDDTELSPIANWLGKFIKIGSDGVPTPSDLVSDTVSLTAEVIGALIYPQTTQELAAGVTPTYYKYEPGNVLRYGAVRDSATNDSAAFQAAIDQAKQTGGARVYVPPGDYHITSTITVANCRDVHIEGTFGSTLQWNGATTSPCLQFGDGTNQTFGISVNGISVEDETAGTGDLTTNGLVLIDQCHRSRFTNMYVFASSELSQGTGILLNESWIVDFYGCRANNLNNSVAFGSDSAGVLATNFYGFQAENFTTAGFNFDATGGFATRINLNGCTIENGELSGGAGTGIGIRITGAGVELNVTGCYFEKNDYDIYISSTGSSDHNLSVRDCWFKSGSHAPAPDVHIYHAGASCFMSVYDSVFVDRDGVTIEHASARYFGHNNTSPSTAEISSSSTYDGLAEGDGVFHDRMIGSGGVEYTSPVFTFLGKTNTPIKTLADSATPSVAGSNVFYSGTQSVAFTNFLDGEDGQVITIIGSDASADFDLTSTNLRGGTTDITDFAAGDVVQFVRDESAGVWRLIGFMDHSVSNATGA